MRDKNLKEPFRERADFEDSGIERGNRQHSWRIDFYLIPFEFLANINPTKHSTKRENYYLIDCR